MKSDLKDRARDGESNKALPLTPPSPPGPPGRGRTCERFVNVRGMLASIPRIEARGQGIPTNTCTIERPGALGPSRRAEWFPLSLSRMYALGNRLALTLTLSPRRGKQVWPRWDESLISERRAALESVSLSPGERAGVRASVLSTELFRLRRGEAHWPLWDESLIGEDPGVLESVSLSLGERVGVRASVLRN